MTVMLSDVPCINWLVSVIFSVISEEKKKPKMRKTVKQ